MRASMRALMLINMNAIEGEESLKISKLKLGGQFLV